MAEYWFAGHGWKMNRTQQTYRVLAKNRDGTFTGVFTGEILPDYTGYVSTDRHYQFAACEVKECYSDTMPASRLSPKQQKYMSDLPAGCAWVGIAWMTGSPEYQVFRYTPVGSYKREHNTNLCS